MTRSVMQFGRREILLGGAALGAAAWGGIAPVRAAAPPLGTQVPA